MKTSLIILLLFTINPSAVYSQNDFALKKKAEKLIKDLKDNGNYPSIAGNDTLIDLNGDRYKDILIEYYGSSGTGLKNRIQVFLYHPSHNKFKECEQLNGLANPTFYLSKKIITGYYVANGGGYATKLKWNHLKLITIEYFDIDVNNSDKRPVTFTLSYYNYVTKKKQVKTLPMMKLPEEYNYMDYVPIIKTNGG